MLEKPFLLPIPYRMRQARVAGEARSKCKKKWRGLSDGWTVVSIVIVTGL
jgi:hypothetical protein